jgi:hypothetical protein
MVERDVKPIITTLESFNTWLRLAHRRLDEFLSSPRSLTLPPESDDDVLSRARPGELVVELFRAKPPIYSARNLQVAVRLH